MNGLAGSTWPCPVELLCPCQEHTSGLTKSEAVSGGMEQYLLEQDTEPLYFSVTGRHVLAAEALKLGIIDEIVKENTVERAIELASKVSGKERKAALVTILLARDSSSYQVTGPGRDCLAWNRTKPSVKTTWPFSKYHLYSLPLCWILNSLVFWVVSLKNLETLMSFSASKFRWGLGELQLKATRILYALCLVSMSSSMSSAASSQGWDLFAKRIECTSCLKCCKTRLAGVICCSATQSILAALK